ncbi:MAG: hypothetical protein AB9869_37245 [Verrucomicrobiia bacterium]
MTATMQETSPEILRPIPRTSCELQLVEIQETLEAAYRSGERIPAGVVGVAIRSLGAVVEQIQRNGGAL